MRKRKAGHAETIFETSKLARKTLVLLAEDDPTVRNFVQAVLTRAGHHVISAGDGAEALQVSHSHNGTIDLLLTDLNMPNLDGLGLIKAIHKDRPGIRILLMTAASNQVPEAFKPVLVRKPFTPEYLLKRIEDALSCPPGAAFCARRIMDARRSETAASLRRKLAEAHVIYSQATAEYQRLMELSRDLEESAFRDGNLATQQANRVREQARTRYEDALQAFMDFIVAEVRTREAS